MGEQASEVAVLATDGGDGRVLLGWSVPETSLSAFLESVDTAARSAGGRPLVEVDFERPGSVTESEFRRAVIDGDPVGAAQRILRGA